MPFLFTWQMLQQVEAQEEEARLRDEQAWGDVEVTEDDEDQTSQTTSFISQRRGPRFKPVPRKIFKLGNALISKHRIAPTTRRRIRHIVWLKSRKGSDPNRFNPQPVIGLWNRALWPIILTTPAHLETCPPFDPVRPEPFQSYWYDFYSRIAQTIANHPKVPKYATMPPVHEISFDFHCTQLGSMDKCPPECASCNKGVPKQLTITRDPAAGRGITNVDIVLALREYMHGGQLTRPGVTMDLEGGAHLVLGLDWMAPVPGGFIYRAEFITYAFYLPERGNGEIVYATDNSDPTFIELLWGAYDDMRADPHPFYGWGELHWCAHRDQEEPGLEALMKWLKEIDWEWDDVSVEHDGEEEGVETE
jgi:hypothetical protein